jgi:hypothetical protein
MVPISGDLIAKRIANGANKKWVSGNLLTHLEACSPVS